MERTTRICILAPVFVLATLIAMCVVRGRHLNKECEYRPVQYDCGCGVLRARLIGTPVTHGKETVRGSPYELFIWFHSPDSGGTVTLKRLELRDADTRGHVYAKMEEHTESFDRVSTGGYAAYFCLKGLNLEYIRYVLSIQLVVNKGEKTESRDVELLFEQNYREYRSNALWDAVMSV
jgi:hypothetical protein